jgi:hypothetical protein
MSRFANLLVGFVTEVVRLNLTPLDRRDW